MTFIDTVMSIAREELGVHEVPDGSNTSPRIREYQAATWLPGTGWPWCVAYVQWVYKKAGRPIPYRTAASYDFLDWATKVGWRTYTPRRGDIVIWNIGAGHTSLFRSDTATTVLSIDGNVSNRVKFCERHKSLVRGYIRIPANTPDVPVPKPPKWEVVTSINGHKQVVFTGNRFQAAKKAVYWMGRKKNVLLRRKRRGTS